MTVLDATNKLFEFFKKNDAYSHKDDFLKLVIISENPEKDEAAVELALQEFVKLDIASFHEIKNKKYYVLKKSWDSYEQTVKITSLVAKLISDLINNYSQLVSSNITSDPKNITEEDIKNLYIICSSLISSALERKEVKE